MSTFRLIYDEADEADERMDCHAVTIIAEHASVVLQYLDSHYGMKPVEFWRDGECLGHLTLLRDHGLIFWGVGA